MKVAGIVAEYNPFHSGHRYQIGRTRAELGETAAVVAVMSGNWVQQAYPAAADKWTRARLALMGGVDLVLELPTVWACSSAESFARGAVDILAAAGVVEVISFGSECGDVDALRRVAACLDSPSYQAELRRLTDSGLPFAAARQRAVGELLPARLSDLLSTPNNNLGVEYIKELNALKSDIVPMTVRREGAAHNSVETERPQFVSATQLRLDLAAGDWDAAEPYLVAGGRDVLEQAGPMPTLARAERAVMARLRTMTADDWAALPDSGGAEGLPRRLERAARQAATLEEFFTLAKTKRYAHARVRRLALWAFLGLTAADKPDCPPYLRVLGFTGRGREVLREMKGKAALPILTKPAHARELDETGRRLFELESRCTDLYGLCMETVPPCGGSWTNSPVVL